MIVMYRVERHSAAYLPPGLVGWQFGELVIHFIGHILHEPFEALTVVVLLELKLFADVTDRRAPAQGLPGVVILFVFFIHPHFHHSHVVLPARIQFKLSSFCSKQSSFCARSNDSTHGMTHGVGKRHTHSDLTSLRLPVSKCKISSFYIFYLKHQIRTSKTHSHTHNTICCIHPLDVHPVYEITLKYIVRNENIP